MVDFYALSYFSLLLMVSRWRFGTSSRVHRSSCIRNVSSFMLVNFPMVRIFFCTSSFHFSSIPRSPSMASFLPCLSPPFDLFSPPSFTPVPFSAFVVPFFFLLFGPLNYLQVLSCDYVHLFFDSSPYFIILLDLIFFVAGYSPLFLLFFTL